MFYRAPIPPYAARRPPNPLSSLLKTTAVVAGAALLTKPGREAASKFLNGTPITEIIGQPLNQLLSPQATSQIDTFWQNLAELLRTLATERAVQAPRTSAGASASHAAGPASRSGNQGGAASAAAPAANVASAPAASVPQSEPNPEPGTLYVRCMLTPPAGQTIKVPMQGGGEFPVSSPRTVRVPASAEGTFTKNARAAGLQVDVSDEIHVVVGKGGQAADYHLSNPTPRPVVIQGVRVEPGRGAIVSLPLDDDVAMGVQRRLDALAPPPSSGAQANPATRSTHATSSGRSGRTQGSRTFPDFFGLGAMPQSEFDTLLRSAAATLRGTKLTYVLRSKGWDTSEAESVAQALEASIGVGPPTMERFLDLLADAVLPYADQGTAPTSSRYFTQLVGLKRGVIPRPVQIAYLHGPDSFQVEHHQETIHGAVVHSASTAGLKGASFGKPTQDRRGTRALAGGRIAAVVCDGVASYSDGCGSFATTES